MERVGQIIEELFVWLQSVAWVRDSGVLELDPFLLLYASGVLFLLLISARLGSRHKREIGELQAENVRLKSEFNALRAKQAVLGLPDEVELQTPTEEFQLPHIQKEQVGKSPESVPEVDSVEISAPGISASGISAPGISASGISAPGISASGISAPRGLLGGLKKTRALLFSGLSSLVAGKRVFDEATLLELEELLITSDLGVQTAKKLVAAIQEQTKGESVSVDELRGLLKNNISEILSAESSPEILPKKREGLPLVVLVVGVNGVGKTTTIGKLASLFQHEGAKVVLAACDTFRAAAVEQLEVWGSRVGVEVVSGQEGAKPSTIAFESVHRAKDGDFDVLIVDTAGRLHTRVNLMNELENVVNIIKREQPGSPHETILVLDASTGQNALAQAREFHQRTSLTGIVITKLDGTPKGGIVVAIKDELGVPIRYVGVGEGIEDLRPFSADDFVEALFAEEKETGVGSVGQGVTPGTDTTTPGQVKRKRRRAHE